MLDIIQQSKPCYSKKIINDINEIISKGYLARGYLVNKIEKKISMLHEYSNTISTVSGTTALFLLIRSLFHLYGKGKIIIPAYCCTSIYYAILSAGFEVEVIDIDQNNVYPSKNMYLKAIDKNVKAMLFIHTFGIFSKSVDEQYPTYKIEDCAHGIGGKFKNKNFGTFGDASIFSFYPTKMISCAGGGGAVLTNNDKIINILKDLIQVDSLNKKYLEGYNQNISEIDASIGINQLNRLEGFIKKRREIAKKYDSCVDKAFLPVRSYKSDTFYRYIIKAKSEEQANEWINNAKRLCIIVDRPIEKPLFMLPEIYSKGKYRHAKKNYERLVSIPLYPSLTDVEINRICKYLRKLK